MVTNNPQDGIYTVLWTGGNYYYIVRWERGQSKDCLEINKRDSNGKKWTSRSAFTSNSLTRTLYWHNANREEAAWLDACRSRGEFISLEDVQRGLKLAGGLCIMDQRVNKPDNYQIY